MLNFKVTMQGNLLTLAHPTATIQARKQGFMSYIEVIKAGRTVYSRCMHRDKAPPALIQLAKEWMHD